MTDGQTADGRTMLVVKSLSRLKSRVLSEDDSHKKLFITFPHSNQTIYVNYEMRFSIEPTCKVSRSSLLERGWRMEPPSECTPGTW